MRRRVALLDRSAPLLALSAAFPSSRRFAPLSYRRQRQCQRFVCLQSNVRVASIQPLNKLRHVTCTIVVHTVFVLLDVPRFPRKGHFLAFSVAFGDFRLLFMYFSDMHI